jgi:hypothetical protein
VIGIDPTVGPALFARQIAAGLAALVRAALRGDRRAARRQLAAVRGSVDYFVFFGLRHRHVRRFLAGRDGPDEVSLQWLLDRAGVGREHTVFLKMDIEGAEYGVVPDIVRLGRWINGVIIEFHRVGRKARAFNEAIAQLRQHFEVVHVHGNNYGGYDQRSGFPDAVEVTLVHRSLLPGPVPPSTHDYPVAGLDFPNRPGRPDHPLRFD